MANIHDVSGDKNPKSLTHKPGRKKKKTKKPRNISAATMMEEKEGSVNHVQIEHNPLNEVHDTVRKQFFMVDHVSKSNGKGGVVDSNVGVVFNATKKTVLLYSKDNRQGGCLMNVSVALAEI